MSDMRTRAAGDVRALLADGVELLRDMQRATGHNRATLHRALSDIGAVRGDIFPYRFTLPNGAPHMTDPTHTLPTPADQREAPAVTFVPATDDHDSAAVLTYRGVTVTVSLRSLAHAAETGTDAGTVLVVVDTDPEAESTPLSIQLNDSDVFEGVVR